MIRKNLTRLAFVLFLFMCFVLPAQGADFYVGSKKGKWYHYSYCKRAKRIKPTNIIKLKTPEDARAKGYMPCNLCKPPKAMTVRGAAVKRGVSEKRTRKAEELCERGKALALEQRCAEALPYYDRAIREDPGHVDAYFQSGVCKSEAGRRKEAIEAFRKTIALDPSHEQAHYSLGVLYARMGRYAEAVEAYRKAIQLKPDDGSAYYNLGVAYATLTRYEDAVGAFKEAVRIMPEVPAAYNNLGVCYGNLKQYPEAAAAFREALRLNPGDAFAGYNLGVISIGLGNYGEAVESLSLVKQTKPDDEATRYHLGVAYARSGDRKSSEEEYRFLLARKSPLAPRLFEEIQPQ